MDGPYTRQASSKVPLRPYCKPCLTCHVINEVLSAYIPDVLLGPQYRATQRRELESCGVKVVKDELTRLLVDLKIRQQMQQQGEPQDGTISTARCSRGRGSSEQAGWMGVWRGWGGLQTFMAQASQKDTDTLRPQKYMVLARGVTPAYRHP